MIGIVIVAALYVLVVWFFATYDSCHLCGAKPEGDFGCPLCKRSGVKRGEPR